jgi:glycosyltransferase involved in cell wall biosynthesis
LRSDRHNGARDGQGDAASVPTFCITTPCYNGVAFLDDTISTIMTQAGNFHLRYHVQDGGSTDGTVAKLERWQRLFDRGDLPINCRSVGFSFTSERDHGMYDAINRGLARLGVGPWHYVGWLNFSDRLAPGALATVETLFRLFPQYRFLGGAPAFIDEYGAVTAIAKPVTASTRLLKAGLHNGQDHTFLQQEGSFWHGSVWLDVGGVAGHMRLAGDFDLWRRFGAHTGYLGVETVIGFHRRHSDQLSSARNSYFNEIQQVLKTDLAGVYETERVAWEAALASASDYRESGFAGHYAVFDFETQAWVLKTDYKPLKLHPLKPRVVVTDYSRTEEIPVGYKSGFRKVEGPYPEYHLEREIRWAVDNRAALVFTAPAAGCYHLEIECRNFWEDLQMTLGVNGGRPLVYDLPEVRHTRNCIVQAEVQAIEGENRIELVFEVPYAKPEQITEYIMVIDVRLRHAPALMLKDWLRRRGFNDSAKKAREERVRARQAELNEEERRAPRTAT